MTFSACIFHTAADIKEAAICPTTNNQNSKNLIEVLASSLRKGSLKEQRSFITKPLNIRQKDSQYDNVCWDKA